MKTFSIRRSVRLGVALLVLVVFSSSAKHWYELRQAQQNLVTLHAIAATKAIALEKTYAYIMRERLGAAVYSFAKDQQQPNQQKRMVDILPQHLANVEKQLNTFASVPLPDARGRQLEDELIQAFHGYLDNFVKPTYQAVLRDDTTEMKRLQLASTDGALSLNTALSEFNNYTSKLTSDRLEETDAEFVWATAITAGTFTLILIFAGVATFGLEKGVIRPLEAALANFERLAQGDLSTQVRESGTSELRRLLCATETMRTSLNEIVSGVRQGTLEMTSSVDEIAAGTGNLSGRTEQQASSLQETSATVEQLAANVQSSAANAKRASELADRACSDATAGKESVAELVETMQGVSNSARRVDEIIAVIEGIAFQTNILALNAAVEAARAGEQGRGFAVVAAEVRSLAQRSAAAAREVKALILDATGRVSAGEIVVEKVNVVVTAIYESVRRASAVNEEIAAAAVEQSIGIGQINQAIGQMDSVTQQNAALVEQAFAATSSLQEQAKHLERLVGVFVV